ncbi:hypothetical protein YM18_1564 [Geobacter sulfurreducens]|nr:hypothetical protein YM18_1564 [Geobacter sulfurreducens]
MLAVRARPKEQAGNGKHNSATARYASPQKAK